MVQPTHFSLMNLISSRLFWKFFVAILAAQLTATLAIGAAVWWKKQFYSEPVSLIESGPRARETLAAAAATLEFAGEAALLKWLQQVPAQQIVVLRVDATKPESTAPQRDLQGQLIEHTLLLQAYQEATQDSARSAARRVYYAGQTYLIFAQRPKPHGMAGWHEFDHGLPRWTERPAPAHADARGRAPMPDSGPPAADSSAPANLQRGLPAPGGEYTGPAKFERNPPPGPLTPWVMLAAAILVSLAFAAFLAWLFTRPLRALQSAFTQAAQGDLRPQFAQANYLIDDELHQLGRSFDQMTARLQLVLEQQTRLMHDVSHELRSPLARIQAALGLIQQQPERTLTYVDRLERESARMDHLIGEILTLARLESGAAQAPLEKLAFSEVIASLLDDMQFEAQQQAQTLTYQAGPDVLVRAELELLVRAIENVLRNAMKYSPAGSEIQLQTSFDAGSGQLSVRICDQGPGVAADEIDAIFQAFYRSRQHAGQASGHGLGLAITRQIVQGLGGQVSAQNRFTEDGSSGLCLTLVLPATLG